MLKKSLCLTLFALVSSIFAQDVKAEKYQLPNGMTVILHEDHSLPVVAVDLWFHVGSKDEQPRRSGFAHLFEHLMFMGTSRVPTGQYDGIMEGGGGSNNATTAEDRTNFYDSGPSSLLPTLLWLEADRLEGLGKAMDQKKLDLQREVVKNERRQSYENAPYGPAHLAIYGIMYPEGHPYHIPVIGTTEDLNAATVQDVKDFFATYYVPNNVSMVVAGDFNTKEVKSMIADLFGTLPRQNDPIHRTAPPVQFEGVHRITMVDKVRVPKIIMVWHSPAAFSPGDINMQLASSVLADGVGSRLYQRLVVEKELATDVSASQDSLMLGSLFSIEITPQQNAPLEQIEHEVDDVLAIFTKDGPKTEELKRQAAKIEYATLSGLQAITEVADKLNEYEYFLGEPNSFKKVLDLYRSASARDIRDTARQVLRPDARLIMHVLPEPVTIPGARDKRPADSSESAFSLPKPKTFKLSNGMAVNYWYRPELPLTQIATVFKSPGALDPSGKAGRLHLLATIMDQGAGSMDSTDLDNALSMLGADITEDASRSGLILGLTTLSSNFDKAVDFYSTAVLKPRFDNDDWSRIKKEHLSDLKDTLARPGAVAQHVSNFKLFGEGPYSVPLEGTPDTVNSLHISDLKDAYAQVVRPENAVVFAAGSIDEATMRAALEKRFGSWRAEASPLPPAQDIKEPSTDGLKVYIVDKADAPQTVIRFALPAPNFNTPQRIELEALASALGGTFTSRLNHNLREDKGYTYGAGSSFYMDPRIGLFVASADVRADVTGASLKEFMMELNKIRAGDVTPEEAQKVRLSMRSDLVQSLAGANGLVGSAVGMWLDDRDFNTLDDELARIGTLNAASINAVAKSGIQLEHGVLVLVGSKELILKQLEGLGLPKPEIVEPR